MKWVKQEHLRGCGVAALAMIMKKSYEDIHKDFPHVDDENGCGYNGVEGYLVEHGYALARFHRCKGYEDRKPWPPEPFAEVHLCNVKVFQESPCSHWVIMLKDGSVLDPLTPDIKKLMDYNEVNNVAAVIKY